MSDPVESSNAQPGFSRRRFVSHLATGAGALWLSTIMPDLALAHAHVDQKVALGKTGEWEFFTSDQAKEVDAICSQIIPTDDTPGAHEAHVVNFIDHILAKYEAQLQPDFLKSIQAFSDEAHKQFPAAQHFFELDNAQQMSVMKVLEKTTAFQMLKTGTALGFFTDPRHGGNKDQVGWKLINFDNAGMFRPPFGYYDAQLLTEKKEGQ